MKEREIMAEESQRKKDIEEQIYLLENNMHYREQNMKQIKETKFNEDYQSKLEAHNKRIDEKKQKWIEHIDRENSFTPKINFRSKNIAGQMKRIDERVGQILEKKNYKVERMKQYCLAQENVQYEPNFNLEKPKKEFLLARSKSSMLTPRNLVRNESGVPQSAHSPGLNIHSRKMLRNKSTS